MAIRFDADVPAPQEISQRDEATDAAQPGGGPSHIQVVTHMQLKPMTTPSS